VRYIALETGQNRSIRGVLMAPLGNNRNGTFSESELRAVEHSVFGGRRVLWAGMAAVLLPLAVLLALQYLWLADLERNSAIARQAALKNYLETITKEVHYFYWKISERALNLPPEIFGEKNTGKAAVGRLLQEKGDRRRQAALHRQLPEPGVDAFLRS
jgi:hypothetical protein